MLALTECNIFLNRRPLFSHLSFQVSPGEVLAITGPSGSGKSTLLDYLCGSLSPPFQANGVISLNGKNLQLLPIEARRVGILYQQPLLFPHMTILDNLLFAIPPEGGRKHRIEVAQSALAALEIAQNTHALPDALSGGQQARVALLRTLLSKPDYLLLDEPFSKLDMDLRVSIRGFVKEQIQQANIPTILVTHDQQDVLALADQSLSLKDYVSK